MLNTTTARLSPWLARSAQVDTRDERERVWMPVLVMLGGKLVALTLGPSHSLCLGFFASSHLLAFFWQEINFNEALTSQGSLWVPA